MKSKFRKIEMKKTLRKNLKYLHYWKKKKYLMINKIRNKLFLFITIKH